MKVGSLEHRLSQMGIEANDKVRQWDKENIMLIWHIDDVKDRIEELEYPEQSDEFCREILKEIDDSHDCNYGISWESIDSTIYDKLG